MDYQNAMYYIDKTAGKLTGVQTIDGIPYTFDEYGCAVTGWVSYADGSLYFYNTDASTATGWAVTENGTYYLTADKGAVTGRYTIDGKEYYFGDDKKLKTGSIRIPARCGQMPTAYSPREWSASTARIIASMHKATL